uniref:Uncharacterized protein n=1 Tax=Chrysemys picta bellii TaxID=8478 RepID=A0A8C3F9X0_CHRPI
MSSHHSFRLYLIVTLTSGMYNKGAKSFIIRTAILGQTKGPSSPVSCLKTVTNIAPVRCPGEDEQNRGGGQCVCLCVCMCVCGRGE